MYTGSGIELPHMLAHHNCIWPLDLRSASLYGIGIEGSFSTTAGKEYVMAIVLESCQCRLQCFNAPYEHTAGNCRDPKQLQLELFSICPPKCG